MNFSFQVLSIIYISFPISIPSIPARFTIQLQKKLQKLSRAVEPERDISADSAAVAAYVGRFSQSTVEGRGVRDVAQGRSVRSEGSTNCGESRAGRELSSSELATKEYLRNFQSSDSHSGDISFGEALDDGQSGLAGTKTEGSEEHETRFSTASSSASEPKKQSSPGRLMTGLEMATALNQEAKRAQEAEIEKEKKAKVADVDSPAVDSVSSTTRAPTLHASCERVVHTPKNSRSFSDIARPKAAQTETAKPPQHLDTPREVRMKREAQGLDRSSSDETHDVHASTHESAQSSSSHSMKRISTSAPGPDIPELRRSDSGVADSRSDSKSQATGIDALYADGANAFYSFPAYTDATLEGSSRTGAVVMPTGLLIPRWFFFSAIDGLSESGISEGERGRFFPLDRNAQLEFLSDEFILESGRDGATTNILPERFTHLEFLKIGSGGYGTVYVCVGARDARDEETDERAEEFAFSTSTPDHSPSFLPFVTADSIDRAHQSFRMLDSVNGTLRQRRTLEHNALGKKIFKRRLAMKIMPVLAQQAERSSSSTASAGSQSGSSKTHKRGAASQEAVDAAEELAFSMAKDEMNSGNAWFNLDFPEDGDRASSKRL